MALQPYLEIATQTMGKNVTLARTERLMAHIGNPERKLRVIHVAGTSGKTSTTYYIASMLHMSDQKVGHTVSPHIHALAERVSINGKPISEKKFCTELGEFLGLVNTAPETPSWFECMIAFAYWVFAKENVDYAVMETGLGGLQDSTNVAERADKVCVITDIGYDHMEVLGSELSSIAYQKVGIVHDGNTALMYDQSPDIMQVVRYWVSQHEDTELLTFDQPRLAQAYGGEFEKTLPEYQKRNWLLAFAAYRFIAKRDALPILTNAKLLETQHTHVPGRMDVRSIGGKIVVLDGAHNGQKMRTFAESFTHLYPDRKVPVLLALKQGKDIAAVAVELTRIASSVIVTSFDRGQDLPDKPVQPSLVAAGLREAGVKNVASEADTEKAFALFLEEVDDVGIVTGSFFLLSQVEQQLL